MGLHLKLRPGERLIVNGCVLKNGDRSTKIEIENRADVLRGSEILDGESCQTPVLRIQYEIQVALVSSEHRASLVPDILGRLGEIEEIMAGDSMKHIQRATELVSDGEFYAAFKELAPVVERERLLLAVAEVSSE